MYGDVRELINCDASTPLVKYVRLTYYVDLNLLYDQLTGCYVMGILNLDKKTPMDWNYNRHNTVDTSTYGSDCFLPVPVWSILFICETPFDNLVYPFDRKYKCLDIPNILLTVPYNRMQSYISITLNYHFTKSARLLNLRWLPSATFLGETNQPISYKSLDLQ